MRPDAQIAVELKQAAADVQLGRHAAVRPMRTYTIPLVSRPVNVYFQRHIPGDLPILYTVHWSASELTRAITTPRQADDLVLHGYKVADGDPPEEWYALDRVRR